MSPSFMMALAQLVFARPSFILAWLRCHGVMTITVLADEIAWTTTLGKHPAAEA